MTEVISVRFRGGCKNYYFDPKGHTVKMSDQVIVETAQGPEFGTCTQGNHEVADEAIVQPLCAMLRPATAAEAAEMPAERLPLNKRIGNASFKRSGRIPLRTFYTGVQTWENLTAYCLPVILTIPS